MQISRQSRLTELDLSELFSKKLIMVTGKGGIGKTVVAASLGQAAAAQGLSTLVIETSARDQLGPLFGRPTIGHKTTEVQANLSCINLTEEGNLREYVTKYLGQEMLYNKLFANKMVKSFFNVIPGFGEVMLLGRLFYTCELAQAPRPDLVIFDGPASGHFYSLMTTPSAIEATNLGGPLVKETVRVRKFLADEKKCTTLFVGVPEELVVTEMIEFIPKLMEKSPCQVGGILMNRSLQHIKDLQGLDGEAREFWQTKQDKGDIARNLLVEGLASVKKDLPVMQLPELGFLSEPLSEDFGQKIWKGAYG